MVQHATVIARPGLVEPLPDCPPNCPTCRKTQEWLSERFAEYAMESAVERGDLLLEDVRGDRNECA